MEAARPSVTWRTEQLLRAWAFCLLERPSRAEAHTPVTGHRSPEARERPILTRSGWGQGARFSQAARWCCGCRVGSVSATALAHTLSAGSARTPPIPRRVPQGTVGRARGSLRSQQRPRRPAFTRRLPGRHPGAQAFPPPHGKRAWLSRENTPSTSSFPWRLQVT